MRKVFLSLLLASVVMVSFSSCGKDKPNSNKNRIEGTIDKSDTFDKNLAPLVDLDEYFVEVKVAGQKGAYEIMTSSDIKNNKFSLKLKNPTVKISNITDIFRDKNLTISNKEAKITAIEKLKVRKKTGDNDYIGNLQYIKSNLKHILVKLDDEKIEEGKINLIGFFYVDSDVKITGTITNDQDEVSVKNIFNLNLKKGWNIINTYRTKNYTTNAEMLETTVLTKMPTDYKWYILR